MAAPRTYPAADFTDANVAKATWSKEGLSLLTPLQVQSLKTVAESRVIAKENSGIGLVPWLQQLVGGWFSRQNQKSSPPVQEPVTKTSEPAPRAEPKKASEEQASTLPPLRVPAPTVPAVALGQNQSASGHGW